MSPYHAIRWFAWLALVSAGCWMGNATAQAVKDTVLPSVRDSVPSRPFVAPHGIVRMPRRDVRRDTVPARKRSWLGQEFHDWGSRYYRDSVLSRLNKPSPPEDSSMIKGEQVFFPMRGKHIRNVILGRVKVFGTTDLTDTAFKSRNKLINVANDVHYDSRHWVIKESLFFGPGDTVNPYILADNERYLRSLPFIQDARIFLIQDKLDSSVVDVLVNTKDVFEYGGALNSLATNNANLSVYNNDLFGAGQSLTVGYQWNTAYNPINTGQVAYTKSNVAGSFANVSVGFTTLNNNAPLDTNNWEGSYYLQILRPLYRNNTKLLGGLNLANNFSINIHGLPDTFYRAYRYNIVDVWAGYNFRPEQNSDGVMTKRPNLAFLVRHYNLYFLQTPGQEQYKLDPSYNNHRYVLGEFAIFKQDYFKTQYFFDFGRTEDIPMGYNIGLFGGADTWVQRPTLYAGINADKYWVTPRQGLLHTTIGVGGFWYKTNPEDDVIHLGLNYYSRLYKVSEGMFRQFFTVDFLSCPDNYFYKPVNVNMPFGIYGFEYAQNNGFNRLNLRSQTTYYSPLKVYGFKFNFLATIQTSEIWNPGDNPLDTRMYSGFGLGCEIRNENLAVNTIKLDGNYYPVAPPGIRQNFYFELTTISEFRFNLFPLSSPPSYISYR